MVQTARSDPSSQKTPGRGFAQEEEESIPPELKWEMVGIPGLLPPHLTCCSSRAYPHFGNRLLPLESCPASSSPPHTSRPPSPALGSWVLVVPPTALSCANSTRGDSPKKIKNPPARTRTRRRRWNFCLPFPSLLSLAGKRKKLWVETGCPGAPKNLGWVGPQSCGTLVMSSLQGWRVQTSPTSFNN